MAQQMVWLGTVTNDRSMKKEKSKEHDSSDDDEQTESNSSDSGTDSDEVRKHEKKYSSRESSHAKKHKKKSSKAVVIRNIYYTTSNRKNEKNDGSSYDDSSAESHLLDEDSIKEQVDDVVVILEKRCNSKVRRNKKRGHHDLVIENESNCYSNTDLNKGMSPQLSEKPKGNNAWDAFQNISMVNFANGEDMRPSLKKGVYEDAHLLFSLREPSGGNTLGSPSDFGSESSATRHSNGKYWFVINHSGSSETQEAKRMIFDNESSMSTQKSSSQDKSVRASPIDDSFMV